MKKFLVSFAAVAASFAAQQAGATPSPLKQVDNAKENSASQALLEASKLIPMTQSNGEVHDFVLRRASETGDLMAYHSSHRSHSSHSSHSSHYSSRY